MTRAEVSEKIARMKAVQRGLVKAVGSDYNDQRRFQVREIEVNGKVVSRLMKIDTNLKYLPSEDLFNEIYDLHVGSGHCGRDLLNKKIKEKFANVTIENISARHEVSSMIFSQIFCIAQEQLEIFRSSIKFLFLSIQGRTTTGRIL